MANASRSRPGALGVAVLMALGWWAGPPNAAPGAAAADAPAESFYYGQPVDYPIVFPVGGSDIYFADDDLLGFGACRDGCSRYHEGVDVLAPKMAEVYAVSDATVGWIGSSCCSVFLLHDDGWQSWYIHLNNDTPGTDDGLGWGIAEGIVPGARVTAGQLIGWVGDSGNAEDTTPHLHFELHSPGGVRVDPYPALFAAYSSTTCIRQRPAPLEALLAPGPVLRRGSTGEAVYQLQAFLKVRGYRVGSLDGLFGPATERALRAFQEKQRLEADGLVGSATRATVAAFTARPAFASLTDLGGRLLDLGKRGRDVRELKRWLRAAGFPPGPRPFDGRFTDATEAAVRAFQEAQGLEVDGKVGPLTRSALLTTLGIVGAEVCR